MEKGHWSLQEDKNFGAALTVVFPAIPKDAKKRCTQKIYHLVALFINSRDRKQVRTHYKNFIKNKGKKNGISCHYLAAEMIKSFKLNLQEIRKIYTEVIQRLQHNSEDQIDLQRIKKLGSQLDKSYKAILDGNIEKQSERVSSQKNQKQSSQYSSPQKGKIEQNKFLSGIYDVLNLEGMNTQAFSQSWEQSFSDL